jgi:hypothetical protein
MSSFGSFLSESAVAHSETAALLEGIGISARFAIESLGLKGARTVVF